MKGMTFKKGWVSNGKLRKFRDKYCQLMEEGMIVLNFIKILRELKITSGWA